MTNTFSKICCVFFLSLIFSVHFLFAQNAYKGGEGDGFAYAELILNISGSEEETCCEGFSVNNPVKIGEEIKLHSAFNDFKFSFCEASGKKLSEGKFRGSEVCINTQNLAAGVYFLHCETEKKRVVLKVIIF